ncbi:kinase-like domain-containing protein [Ilyonectria robusta]|uniref:kinase-like domain-containing protein n=1 Tax=Ilyonectria robusta TaxID=1079257 RepID=UPI001E8D24FB|nr:kinase-like domain-containing protein [Ilyonectria robusta]KAH8729156.1 kinase-like domain-containing protein [Ilyonectria robusta]
MANREVVEYHFYCPPGVQRVLACGSSAFIGEVDDSTILKYPLEPGGDMIRLELEHKILTIVGQHPRIIAHKGSTDAGLYLERAANGTILEYLTESDHPAPHLQQRVAWCRQLTEAVDHIHAKRVIHCDIQPTNILVDQNLHLKLADFQGHYLSEDSEVILTGWSGEPCRYFCPRDNVFEANIMTDLFALGSTIYFIMTGHEVFRDIIYGEAGWDEAVRSRFSRGVFPEDSHACAAVTQKCWRQQYGSAGEVLEDIRAIEQDLVGEA